MLHNNVFFINDKAFGNCIGKGSMSADGDSKFEHLFVYGMWHMCIQFLILAHKLTIIALKINNVL